MFKKKVKFSWKEKHGNVLFGSGKVLIKNINICKPQLLINKFSGKTRTMLYIPAGSNPIIWYDEERRCQEARDPERDLLETLINPNRVFCLMNNIGPRGAGRQEEGWRRPLRPFPLMMLTSLAFACMGRHRPAPRRQARGWDSSHQTCVQAAKKSHKESQWSIITAVESKGLLGDRTRIESVGHCGLAYPSSVAVACGAGETDW